MSLELKRQRLELACAKLRELRQAEPQGDPVAHDRAAANHLTTTNGISRPLADRYVAVAKEILAGATAVDQACAAPELLTRLSAFDDRFGASFMVLPHHVEQILKGGKHMSRRFRRWGDPGDTFAVKGKRFRFNRVEQIRVGDITDEDIRKEGYTSREEFEQMWVKSHPKTVAAGKTLDPTGMCWCHEYEPA